MHTKFSRRLQSDKTYTCGTRLSQGKARWGAKHSPYLKLTDEAEMKFRTNFCKTWLDVCLVNVGLYAYKSWSEKYADSKDIAGIALTLQIPYLRIIPKFNFFDASKWTLFEPAYHFSRSLSNWIAFPGLVYRAPHWWNLWPRLYNTDGT